MLTYYLCGNINNTLFLSVLDISYVIFHSLRGLQWELYKGNCEEERTVPTFFERSKLQTFQDTTGNNLEGTQCPSFEF